MAKKCAGSGLLFMHLQFAFQHDGVHAFYDVLQIENCGIKYNIPYCVPLTHLR